MRNLLSKAEIIDSNQNNPTGNQNEQQTTDDHEPVYKCSAINTLERDIPDFDYSDLISELREKLLAQHKQYEGIFSHEDVERCKTDDWFLSRFLIRQKMDVGLAFDMLSKAMRFNNESLCQIFNSNDFPIEFFQIGGLFRYEPDRKGNATLYVRVKIHRKIPEVQSIVQAFIYHNLRETERSTNGKGMVVVLDCSGAGLANADMDTLFFFFQTIRNVFPKALSYFLVHELPWILKPFWIIAKQWIPEEHAQLIKFSNAQTIFEYVDKQNLPDFMGGTCTRDYRQPPGSSSSLYEICKLLGVNKDTIRKVIYTYREYLPEGAFGRIDSLDESPLDTKLTESCNNQKELSTSTGAAQIVA